MKVCHPSLKDKLLFKNKTKKLTHYHSFPWEEGTFERKLQVFPFDYTIRGLCTPLVDWESRHINVLFKAEAIRSKILLSIQIRFKVDYWISMIELKGKKYNTHLKRKLLYLVICFRLLSLRQCHPFKPLQQLSHRDDFIFLVFNLNYFFFLFYTGHEGMYFNHKHIRFKQ
jgi:hypothetical protein